MINNYISDINTELNSKINSNISKRESCQLFKLVRSRLFQREKACYELEKAPARLGLLCRLEKALDVIHQKAMGDQISTNQTKTIQKVIQVGLNLLFANEDVLEDIEYRAVKTFIQLLQLEIGQVIGETEVIYLMDHFAEIEARRRFIKAVIALGREIGFNAALAHFIDSIPPHIPKKLFFQHMADLPWEEFVIPGRLIIQTISCGNDEGSRLYAIDTLLSAYWHMIYVEKSNRGEIYLPLDENFLSKGANVELYAKSTEGVLPASMPEWIALYVMGSGWKDETICQFFEMRLPGFLAEIQNFSQSLPEQIEKLDQWLAAFPEKQWELIITYHHLEGLQPLLLPLFHLLFQRLAADKQTFFFLLEQKADDLKILKDSLKKNKRRQFLSPQLKTERILTLLHRLASLPDVTIHKQSLPYHTDSRVDFFLETLRHPL